MTRKKAPLIKLTEKQFDELAKKLISSNIDDVLGGESDKNSIRYFINQAAVKILDNKPLPKKIRRALAFALYEISKGKDANAALGLIRSHRSKSDASKRRAIALHVWKLVNTNEYSVKKAILTVQEIKHWKIKSEAIKKCYKDYRTLINTEALKIKRNNRV